MASLARLLSSLDRDPRVRGREFERICRWYLRNDPIYRSQVKRVWLWKDWPDRWGVDAGIDLIAELHDGSLLAVQAKAYDSVYSITKADVDTFLSESSRPGFARRLIIGTTNHIGITALRTLRSQSVPAKFIGLGDLERAEVDWPTSADDLRPRRLPPKRPRPHQKRAVEDVCSGFVNNDRGKLVMACGTGKTLVGLWIAERLRARRVLLLFPSLTLLAQTLREWTANASRPFETLAVCSDASVYDQDAFVEHTGDLDLRVTTDPKAIGAFLEADGARVVFATYQSSPELAKAMKADGVPAFDLAIADEAHRCAGPLAGEFATILDAKAIPAKRRLFMTATPRYCTGRVKREAADADYELASMDAPEHFGPLIHELSFGEAIRKGLLADYQVAIVGIDDRTYRDYAQRGVFVTTDGKKVTDARTLAAQLGLARAMRKYELRRTISFHNRIASARTFSASVPEVMAWMPARRRPTGTPWSRHISGEMSSGDRDTLLGRFKELQEDEYGLLANSRCLTEGVDVPAIDGVAFVDPRRSQIDIVQAVGRAIRNSPGKKIGTVVLPVFIETKGKPETTLDSTAFKPIWDVLRALRAHDAALGEQLDALRRELGRRSAGALKLPSKIKFDLPIGVDARFANALRVHIVDTTTASWEQWYGILEAFVKSEGHARVPQRHTTADGMTLGRWVTKQRVAYAEGSLGSERSERLEKLNGWLWDPRAQTWEDSFVLLEAFVQREGHAAPLIRHNEDGFRLGQWVAVQRRQRMVGEITLERAARLEGLPGWTWDIHGSSWEQGFAALQAFAERYGHTGVPRDYRTDDGFRLGSWAREQRATHADGKLDATRVARLETLPGWTWDVLESDWEDAFRLLQTFASRTAHSRVPAKHREAGFRLGSWVSHQRHLYDSRRLRRDRIGRLESLPGWSWKPYEQRWEAGYAALMSFVARAGHARVPSGHREGDFPLGQWVTVRRSEHANGRLSVTRQKALRALPGWSWRPKADAWELGYAALRAFVKREGHGLVPLGHVEGGVRLGSWVGTQRTGYASGQLARDRVKRLENVRGWAWNANEAAWEEGMTYLMKFVERERHARVEDGFREGTYRLGEWVTNQRMARRRGTLTPDRVRRLESLKGWAWSVREAWWRRWLELLRRYAAREGHARVPYSHREGQYELGNWGTG